MNKIRLAVLAAMLVMATAFAQGRLFGEVVSGDMTLVPGFSLSVGAALGAEDVIGPLALRGGASLQTGGGGTVFGIGADVLYFLRQRGSQAEFYFGGGANLRAGGDTIFGIRGVAGVELPVQGSFNLLIEALPTLLFAGGQSQFQLSLVVGPRVYFR